VIRKLTIELSVVIGIGIACVVLDRIFNFSDFIISHLK